MPVAGSAKVNIHLKQAGAALATGAMSFRRLMGL